MLADDQHAVHRKVRAPEGECFRDGRINPHAMTTGPVTAEIAFGKLIDIKRCQFNRRMVVAPLPAVTFEKAIDEMLRVGMRSDLCRKNRNFPLARPGRI